MGGGDPAGRHMFVVACLGGALSSLDSTVNIAFPAIIDGFDVDVKALQWVVVSYVLTFAVLLLPFGRQADRVGHRRTLVLGCVVSAVAVTACAIAPTFGLFLAGRIVQGVGIALVMAAAPALITLSVPEQRRARALGLFQMSVAAGFVAGPPLGGVLLALWDWPAVFLFRVPVALGILALATLSRARTAPPVATTGAPVRSDVLGAVTFAGGLAAALFVASTGSQLGWASPPAVGLVLVAVGLFGAFVIVERRAVAPLVDLSLFRNPAFTVANVCNAVANATMFTIWLLGPTLLITAGGHGTITAGLLLAVTALGTAVAAPVAGRLVGRLGTAQLSTVGLLLESVGLAATSRLGADTPTVGVVIAFTLVGCGVGLFQVPNVSYVMGCIPRSQQGVAGAMTQMVRMTGVVSGVAAANLFLVVRLEARSGSRTLDEAGIEQFTPAFQDVLLAAALLCLAAAALPLLHRSRADPAQQVAVRRPVGRCAPGAPNRCNSP